MGFGGGAGGGNDGGVVATKRAYFIKVRQAEEKADPAEVAATRWTTCALTQEPLDLPIVADELGKLYSKEAIVRALATKSVPKGFKHIKGLKSLITLNLTRNPAAAAVAVAVTAAGGDAGDDDGESAVAGAWRASVPGAFMCPITRIEANGKQPFVTLRPCGCVFAAKALREVPSATCLTCGSPFDKGSDVITLVPSAAEEATMREAMARRRNEKKAAKKAAAGVGGGATAAATAASSSAAALVARASAKLAADKSKSETYSKLFTSSEGTNGRAQPSGNSLFIRTATPLFTQGRRYAD